MPTTALSTTVVWHGHTADLVRLVKSAQNHCTCPRGGGPDGTAPPCGPHQILADQRTLDHLAFARSVLTRLLEEEWRAPATPETRSDREAWSALLAACARERQQRPGQVAQLVPAAQIVPPDRRPPRALGTWLLSVLALVLILGIHGPGGSSAPTVQPIASWQTR